MNVMESHGSMWKHVEACGSLRKAAEGCGRLRKAAEGCGRLRKAAEGCGSPRKPAEACGSLRKLAEAYRTLWPMYLEHSRSQQPVYKDSLPSCSDSSPSNSLCSIIAFLLSLAWLLTVSGPRTPNTIITTTKMRLLSHTTMLYIYNILVVC
jgi:hypothetical protein